MDSFYTAAARHLIGAPPSIAPTKPQSVSEYDPDAARYLPLLAPKLTKKGTVAVHQPVIPKKLASWWKSQCRFRGLPTTGTIEVLQQRIRGHGDKGMTTASREACEKRKIEYEETNKAAIAEIWSSADDTEKAKVWAKAFLYEKLVLPPKSKEEKTVVVFEVNDWGEKIMEACRQMNICCEMRKMQRHQTGQRLVVVGLDELTVRAKFAELSQDDIRAAERARQEAKEREQAAEKEYKRRFKLAKSKGRQSKGPWDVAGSWSIDFPYIQENWGSLSRGQKCSFDIEITEPAKDGRVQMFALFDFIIFSGIMRFVDSQSADVEDDQDDQYEDEGEDEDENEDEEDGYDDDEYTDYPPGEPAESFFFPSPSLPSSKTTEFDYRWRGEDTGTGEIMLGSDEELCSVTFHSPNALSGTFIGPGVGNCRFTGIKTAGRPRKAERNGGLSYPDYQWRSRNSQAYEEANRRRWG